MSDFALWQSRPVFVTSTFRDMHEERDHLHAHVFPVLRERLRARFHHLEPIDLRWGVETVEAGTDEAKELLVLKVCLGEIRRSRPFLIALIGDRYGWQPPEERLRSAAEAEGFECDVAGTSVTALEIEYGVLDSPEQRRFSRFYFREPLPYREMGEAAAEYSDEYSNEPGARAAYARLQELKERIRREMPGRWRNYRAVWAGQVTGLEAWGRQVLEDVWADLDEATRGSAQAESATWQQQEAAQLQYFIEDKSRDFAGRKEVVRRIVDGALSPAGPEALWGLAVSGDTGSGKSALWAHVARVLAGRDAVVLAHAAGVSGRSTQVQTLLELWAGRLSGELGEEAPQAAGDELVRVFGELLGRTAARRRVVCLLDGADQFERTPEAEHLSWLPVRWPENARLVMTAAEGPESAALAGRKGCARVRLPELTAAEAARMVESACARHHKQLHPEVLRDLLARRRADGSPAYGLPRWLELAVIELLLLDADDFAEAERGSGAAEERLHRLLVGVARTLPGSVEELCERVLERADKLHGVAFTRRFTELMAAARKGWRDSDLVVLMKPVAGVGGWDALRFAALRRTLGGHLAQHGMAGEWSFTHRQIRAAVERRMRQNAGSRELRHFEAAEYLAGLPPEDPLRQSELMFHLIEAGRKDEAARYYSGALLDAEEEGATAELAARIAEGFARGSDEGIEWTLRLADEELTDGERERLCVRWFHRLAPALAHRTPLALRARLTDAAAERLERLRARNPEAPDLAQNLAACYGELSKVHHAKGDLARGLECCQRCCEVTEELRRRLPDSADLARMLAAAYGMQGDLDRAGGRAARAEECYRRSLAIREEWSGRVPESRDFRRDVALNCAKLGDLSDAQGERAQASDWYGKALTLWEGLWKAAPAVSEFARETSSVLLKLSEQAAAEDPGRGVEYASRALAIMQDLSRRYPESTVYASDLACCYAGVADLRAATSDLAAADEFYERAAAMWEELCRRIPDSALLAGELAGCYSRMARLRERQGTAGSPAELNAKALEIQLRWHRETGGAAVHGEAAAMSYLAIGDACVAKGDGSGAVEAYERVLGLLGEGTEQPSTMGLRIACETKLGDLAAAAGDSARAEACYRSAYDVCREWQRRAEDRTPPELGLKGICFRLGRLYEALGQAEEALAFRREDLQVRKGLCGRVPQTAERLLDLADAYSKVGDLEDQRGVTVAAQEAYQGAAGVFEELRRRDPDSVEYARDLAVHYTRLGDAHGAASDAGRQLSYYEKACVVFEELRRRVDSEDVRRYQAVSYSKLGSLYEQRESPVRAQEYHGKALEIREGLRAEFPDSLQAARDAAISHSKLGEVQAALGDNGAAIECYRRVIEITERLQAAHPEERQLAEDLVYCYSVMGNLYGGVGEVDAALEFHQKCRAVREGLQRFAPRAASPAREAIRYCRQIGDAALNAGRAAVAVKEYEHQLELLNAFEEAFPGAPPEKEGPLAAQREECCLQLRQAALALYRQGEYVPTEQALRLLAGRRFEPASTACHLARVYLMMGRDAAAMAAVEVAGEHLSESPEYARARIHFLRALGRLLAGRDAKEEIRAIRDLAGLGTFVEWEIGPVLDHLQERLRPSDVRFLRDLAAALSDPERVHGLGVHGRWRECGG